jgi:alpha-glucosidase (family GH31 glycosyl hydrolase)
VDVADGSVHVGGSTVTVATPIERIAVFVRSGASVRDAFL